MRMPMLALLAAVLVLAPTLAQVQIINQHDCAKDWEWYNLFSAGSCYFLSNDQATFDEAQEKCIALNARLVDLHVEAENSFVSGMLIRGNKGTGAWTGGQLDTGKRFSWISGANPHGSWAKWALNEPNQFQKAGSKVYIFNDLGMPPVLGGWDDEVGTRQLYYVCEGGIEAGRVTTAPPPPPTTEVANCWDMKQNTQAHVADQYPAITDLNACLQKCIEIRGYSVDIDRKDPPYLDTYCWIFTPPRKVMLNETNGITGVDHYTYTCTHPTSMQ